MTDTQPKPSPFTYAGLFLLTLATLTFEILLTRIFSVTIGYRLAFVAISLAMFGMTVGALRVYRKPGTYSGSVAKAQMAQSAFWFSLSVFACLLVQFLVPFPSRPGLAVLWICLSYPLLSIPFYYSGVGVCVALTKFPERTGALYAVDLAGAACGCILVIFTLELTDAPTALVVVALLAAIAAVLFAMDGRDLSLKQKATVATALFLFFTIVNTGLVRSQHPLLRVTWAQGREQSKPLYEKWNSYSWVAVKGDEVASTEVAGVGTSSIWPAGRTARQLFLRIDADAETTLTAFDGRLENIDYLKYDISNLAYRVRPISSTLVIGAGGSRDVLSALSFGVRSVTAVEINRNILNTVNGRFGDFTGHLDRDPHVKYVNDEARSYITRTPDRFDLIQASLIDTWAATAAGALSCTENAIYTTEAWTLFLNKLTPNGMISFSRWYMDPPTEAYRITSLATAALHAAGVADPRRHILMARNMRHDTELPDRIGITTILVSKAPFNAAELQNFAEVMHRLQFNVVVSPQSALDPTFAQLADGNDQQAVSASLRLNVTAPTDDIPFFFYTTPPGDALKPDSLVKPGGVVGAVLLLVTFLTVFFVLMPVLQTLPKTTIRPALPYFVFFAAIGLGFMLIEISLMQRFMLFLGHPIYALSVVLFVLLLACGAGSYASRAIAPGHNLGLTSVVALLLVISISGFAIPSTLAALVSSTAPVRVVVAAGSLIPIGFFLGMAFPLGIRLAGQRFDSLTPGLWGINGAASVLGSVLSVMIAMNLGISVSFWTGCGCYLVALAAYGWADRTRAAAAPA